MPISWSTGVKGLSLALFAWVFLCNSKIFHRGIQVDSLCFRCQQSEKDIDRVLFCCSHAKVVWDLLDVESQSAFRMMPESVVYQARSFLQGWLVAQKCA